MKWCGWKNFVADIKFILTADWPLHRYKSGCEYHYSEAEKWKEARERVIDQRWIDIGRERKRCSEICLKIGRRYSSPEVQFALGIAAGQIDRGDGWREFEVNFSWEGQKTWAQGLAFRNPGEMPEIELERVFTEKGSDYVIPPEKRLFQKIEQEVYDFLEG